MIHSYDTMMNPAIEDLIACTESKFILVTLAAKRSREITNYLGQFSGIGSIVPPQVESESTTKPLSTALEEIAAEKIRANTADTGIVDTDKQTDLESLTAEPELSAESEVDADSLATRTR